MNLSRIAVPDEGIEKARVSTFNPVAHRSVVVTSQAATSAKRVARTCHNPDCSKNPYFGWHGGKAISCVAHKEPGELHRNSAGT